MRRRPITSAPALTALIGKEGNRLLERATGEIDDCDQYRNLYRDQAAHRWTELVLPVLVRMLDALGTGQISRDIGVADRTIRNWVYAGDIPHAGGTQNRQRVERYVHDWARGQLQAAGRPVPSDPSAALYAYLGSQ